MAVGKFSEAWAKTRDWVETTVTTPDPHQSEGFFPFKLWKFSTSQESTQASIFPIVTGSSVVINRLSISYFLLAFFVLSCAFFYCCLFLPSLLVVFVVESASASSLWWKQCCRRRCCCGCCYCYCRMLPQFFVVVVLMFFVLFLLLPGAWRRVCKASRQSAQVSLAYCTLSQPVGTLPTCLEEVLTDHFDSFDCAFWSFLHEVHSQISCRTQALHGHLRAAWPGNRQ